MNMKKILLFLVLAVIIAGSVFAQARKGYIKPTFGFGFATISQSGYSETGAAMSFDIDFVSSIGLTLGVQNLFTFSDWGLNMHPFGAGYTYTADRWGVGGKFMVVPTSLVDGGIGFDVNGTYWFTEYIGITGILDLYLGMAGNGGTVFSMRIGASTKF
jgi:hypothetical protein